MKSEPMRVFLAGPMRGIIRNNFDAFFAAETRGQSLGHIIVNPARMDVDDNPFAAYISVEKASTPHMLRFYARRNMRAIIGDAATPGCDAIALLPGWEKSSGATAELALAKWLGLAVLDAQTFEPMPAVEATQ